MSSEKDENQIKVSEYTLLMEREKLDKELKKNDKLAYVDISESEN